MKGALVALGQALFTLSVGMGAVMAYGAYLPEETNIGNAAVTVVLADTSIAILAGLVIFPVVFGFGLTPNEGPGTNFSIAAAGIWQHAGWSGFWHRVFCVVKFRGVDVRNRFDRTGGCVGQRAAHGLRVPRQQRLRVG